MRTFLFAHATLALVCLSSAGVSAAAQTGSLPTDAELANPKVLSAWKDAKEYESNRNITAAVDEYKKANKAAGGSCVACLNKVYALGMKVGLYKDAAQASAQLAAATQVPLEKSLAESDEAQALYMSGGDRPKPAQLQAVDELLKAALKDDTRNNPARYLDGRVLAQMGQMDAAKAQFAACLAAASPKDPTYGRVKRFAENPELSFQKRAPAFTVTALDGSKFNLDDMGGRVVLIDFWATWCGPCNEELPQMKKIAKDFAGQPLVILSISWDADAAKWKDFIAKHEMTWPQYRDADQDLTKRFGISAIPHYFTIDSDGVLTSEMLGSGSDVEGKLRKLVARAKKAQESQVASAAAPAPAASAAAPASAAQ